MKTPTNDEAARPRKKKKARVAAAAEPGLETRSPAPEALGRGAMKALLALLGLGLVVAVYLTVAHLELFHGTGSFHSICNFGERLSCDAVNTSEESEIFGVAVAVFAVPAYTTLFFLVGAALREGGERGRFALGLAHLLTWPIVAYSVYLIAIMVGKLGTLCLFCLTLDTVNVSALVLTAVAARRGPRALLGEIAEPLRGTGKRLAMTGAGLFAITLGAALAWHASLRATLEAEARAAVSAEGETSAVGSAKGGAEDGPSEPQKGARKLPTKRWEVPIDEGDASVGPKDAKVTVIEFADFQCGYCKKLESGLAVVRKTFASEVRFVFKHFPMNTGCNGNVQHDKHVHACEAAEGAECARRQGKFWPMHAELYGNQQKLGRADLDRHAATIGLDLPAFTACMSDPAVIDAIRRDADEGAQVKVNGTPRTFVNGRLFAGVLSDDLLTFVIRVELGQVTGKAAEAYVPKEEPSSAPALGPSE
ncbi:MAG: vitamin K epoxide reductase family protein [Minicystis sp.]